MTFKGCFSGKPGRKASMASSWVPPRWLGCTVCTSSWLPGPHPPLTRLHLHVGPGLMAPPGWDDEVCRPRGAPFPGNSEDSKEVWTGTQEPPKPREWGLGHVLLGGKKDEVPCPVLSGPLPRLSGSTDQQLVWKNSSCPQTRDVSPSWELFGYPYPHPTV